MREILISKLGSLNFIHGFTTLEQLDEESEMQVFQMYDTITVQIAILRSSGIDPTKLVYLWQNGERYSVGITLIGSNIDYDIYEHRQLLDPEVNYLLNGCLSYHIEYNNAIIAHAEYRVAERCSTEIRDYVFLEYNNYRNDFETMFNPDEDIQFRLRGAVVRRSEEQTSDDDDFRDQVDVLEQLSGRARVIRVLEFEGPGWVGSKVNRILACSSVKIDGVRYVRVTGSGVSKDDTYGPDMFRWSVKLERVYDDAQEVNFNRTITYNVVGGTPSTVSFTVPSNSILVLPKDTASIGITMPPNYEFLGWASSSADDVKEVIVCEDMTFEAKLENMPIEVGVQLRSSLEVGNIVRNIAVSADGQFMAVALGTGTGTGAGTLRLFKLTDGVATEVAIQSPAYGARTVLFNPVTNILYVGLYNKGISTYSRNPDNSGYTLVNTVWISISYLPQIRSFFTTPDGQYLFINTSIEAGNAVYTAFAVDNGAGTLTLRANTIHYVSNSGAGNDTDMGGSATNEYFIGTRNDAGGEALYRMDRTNPTVPIFNLITPTPTAITKSPDLWLLILNDGKQSYVQNTILLGESTRSRVETFNNAVFTPNESWNTSRQLYSTNRRGNMMFTNSLNPPITELTYYNSNYGVIQNLLTFTDPLQASAISDDATIAALSKRGTTNIDVYLATGIL